MNETEKSLRGNLKAKLFSDLGIFNMQLIRRMAGISIQQPHVGGSFGKKDTANVYCILHAGLSPSTPSAKCGAGMHE